MLHLDDAFDAADCRIEESAESPVVVHIVCISKAHEDDEGRKPWSEADCDATRLQICEKSPQSVNILKHPNLLLSHVTDGLLEQHTPTTRFFSK